MPCQKLIYTIAESAVCLITHVHIRPLQRETGDNVRVCLQSHELETVGEMLVSMIKGARQLSAAVVRYVPGNFLSK